MCPQRGIVDTLSQGSQVGATKAKKRRRTIKERRDIVEETLSTRKTSGEADFGAVVQCATRTETEADAVTVGSSYGPDELSSFYFEVVC